MPRTLMVIIDPVNVPESQLESFCRAVARGGVTSVQFRDKTSDTRDLVGYGRGLRHWTEQLGMALIVNDRVDVALAVDADGVHVGQTDMPVEEVRRIAPRLSVGLSISTEDEARRAGHADYYGVGPVFPTPSKPDAAPALGLLEFRRIVDLLTPLGPVIAIGGISQDNANQVWDTGVQGLAVISAILAASDYERASRALLPQ